MEEFANQLRVSGGFTYSPGCLLDSGRQSWRAMCARMGITASGTARRTQTPPPSPKPEDYAVPTELAGTKLGRLYAFLLACADTSEICPTSEVMIEVVGQHRGYGFVATQLRELEKMGYIRLPRWTRQTRTIEIVATGQVMRNAAARNELAAS